MGEFNVFDGKTIFIVNPTTRHYDCMAWDISRIPCKQAIRYIIRDMWGKKKKLEDFVDDAYSLTNTNTLMMW